MGHIDGHPRLDQGASEALGKAPIVLDKQYSHRKILRRIPKELLKATLPPDLGLVQLAAPGWCLAV
jgi:hypothetical protein